MSRPEAPPETCPSLQYIPLAYDHESNLLRLVNHVLHYALDSFKFWTHLRTCTDRCNRFVKTSLLIRIGEESIFDRFLSFGVSSWFELETENKCRVRSPIYVVVHGQQTRDGFAITYQVVFLTHLISEIAIIRCRRRCRSRCLRVRSW